MKFIFAICMLFITQLTFCQSQQIKNKAATIVKKCFLIGCKTGSAFSWTKSGNDSGVGVYSIFEIKGLNWEIKTEKLTAADSLNGYSWRGYIKLRAQVFREFEIFGQNVNDVSTHNKIWNKWHDFPNGYYIITIEKINGIWKDYEVSGRNAIQIAGSTGPTCEDIKRETKL